MEDKTDVAIVAEAFERWGTDCFAKLIGDWALSIWNPRKKELILARDYIGVRHLFYYPNRKTVIWCNHLDRLALCGDQFTICEKYVAGLFAFWPESQLTPYSEIHSVASGSFVRIRRGHICSRAYWTFNPRLKTRYRTDEEYEENFRHLFRQSVRRRLRADSPILAELSGGLDSSSIVCMTDEILSTEGGDTSSVDTFSSSDRDEPDEDDFPYFTKVEEKRGRVGHHAELKSLGDTLRFDYPRFVATPGFSEREEWIASQSSVIKRGKYRVLLSGDGGDEILGQGLDPRTQMADRLARFKLQELSRLLSAWSLCARRPWIQLLSQAFVILMPTQIRTRLRRVSTWEPWLNPRFARRHGITDRLLPASAGTWLWLPSVRDSFQSLQNLSGAMTSARPFCVEKRFPFLDQTLTEFLTSIPAEQLLRPRERRSLLRRSLINILPKEIVLRRTKSSGGRCGVLSLQKHWNILENILHSPITSRLGYTRHGSFEAALLAMRSGRLPPYVVQLLRAVSLELWLRDAAGRGVLSIPDSVGRDIWRVTHIQQTNAPILRE